jgi:hypothetical protein
MDKFREAIRAMVKEEMSNMLPAKEHDHEAKMAKGELRDMITNGAELYKMIQDGDNLPGWVSAYITLASDYMHSVYGYMIEKQEN